jgi:hypothetical protein
MRLDASYNRCSKLGSKLILRRYYGTFSFTRPFLDFECIFLSDLFLKVGPDKIYAFAFVAHMEIDSNLTSTTGIRSIEYKI